MGPTPGLTVRPHSGAVPGAVRPHPLGREAPPLAGGRGRETPTPRGSKPPPSLGAVQRSCVNVNTVLIHLC